MSLINVSRRILFVCFLSAAATLGATAFAQGADQAAQRDTKNDEINLDTQLYLLIATNQDVDNAKLPPNLDGVVKQLRASLPFKNYRLAATLINRVKNYVKLATDANGREVVRMDGFRFGARIPIQTGTAIASNGPAAPIINYENTGLNTDISMHEGEPVIVGTLNVGPSGDAIILVMTARRSSK